MKKKLLMSVMAAVFVGMTVAIIGIITGYIKYSRKDIS